MNGVRARMLGVAVAAASLGAGAGVIANAGAHSGTTHATARAAHYGREGGRFAGPIGGPAVEGSAVVYADGAYKTVSFNRGTVVSTGTNTITIDEKAPGASSSYPSKQPIDVTGATVYNNGQASTLSSLTSGERVTVLHGPSKTLVIAHDPSADSGWSGGHEGGRREGARH